MNRRQRHRRAEEVNMNFYYIYVTDDGKRSPPFSVEAKDLGHALQKLAAQLSDAVEIRVWRTATVHRIGPAAEAPDAA
jgi:hypothetical protein